MEKFVYPPKSITDNAHIKDYDALYQSSIKDRQGFWEQEAEKLEWFQKWDKVLDDSNAPFYKWFTGAKTNIVHNAIDRHLSTWRRNKLAFIWEGEPGRLPNVFLPCSEQGSYPLCQYFAQYGG